MGRCGMGHSNLPFELQYHRNLAETMDGTDLSTVAKSNNGKLCATGDDCGKIKLYTHPVTQPKSLNHTNGGHSSYVTRVEFLADDSRLISTGGRDTAIMQWNLS